MGEKNIWTPNVGVGPIKFGTPVSEYVESGLLARNVYPPELGGTDWYASQDGDPVVIVDENGAVDIVLCENEFLYRGRDLIGMQLLAELARL